MSEESPPRPRPWDLLVQLLDEAGLVPVFGLEAQGHVPTIERMLAEGASWQEIGKAIGWCPETAREHWEGRTEDADDDGVSGG